MDAEDHQLPRFYLCLISVCRFERFESAFSWTINLHLVPKRSAKRYTQVYPF